MNERMFTAAVKKNLEERGFTVKVFVSAAEAAEYLDSVIDDMISGLCLVALGEMRLYKELKEHNEGVYWH